MSEEEQITNFITIITLLYFREQTDNKNHGIPANRCQKTDGVR